MFILSKEQIENIITDTFPLEDNFYIKNATVNLIDTDTHINIEILVQDNIITPKIFNKPSAKKMMKMKIFEINSQLMNREILSADNIDKINLIIKNNGVFFRDFNPTEDFIGNKTDPTQHNLINDNTVINLLFKQKIVLPTEKINYFSLGIVFYNDLQIYLLENNLSPQFVQKEILFKKTKIIPLFADDKAKQNYILDIRQYKKSAKKQQALKNSEIGLEELYANLNIDNKNIKILSKNRKKIKSNIYFSNINFSRNTNGTISFLFNIDYASIIRNNFSYKNYIINSTLQDTFFNQTKISSIDICRRRVRKTNYSGVTKIEILDQPIENIINSSDTLENNTIFANINRNASIKETSVVYGVTGIRTIEGVDSTVYTKEAGLYQYGVRLTLADNFKSFIFSLIKNCRNDIKNIEEYYNETNKDLKTIKAYLDKRQQLGNINTAEYQGVYDPLLSKFTDSFIKNTFEFKYLNNVFTSIARLTALLKTFGILKTDSETARIVLSFATSLAPSFATAESILLFINLYKKFIVQIEKIGKNISGENITLEHWFSNDYVDIKDKIDIGYQFIENEDRSGLGTVTTNQLEFLALQNIAKYSSNNEIENKYLNLKYCFIGPSAIRTPNHVINLDDTIQDSRLIKKINYFEAELDIKRHNGLGIHDAINYTEDNKNELIIKTLNLLKDFSISVENVYKEIPTQNQETSFARAVLPSQPPSNFQAELNENVDPTDLMMILTKNFVMNKKTFFSGKKSLKSYNRENALKIDRNFENNFPYQLSMLVNGQSRLFFSEDEYLTFVNINSIFLFFYSTLHSIEYLTYNSQVISASSENPNETIRVPNLKDENWQLLTLDKISTLDSNSLYLCRIKLYQNSIFGNNNFEQINLPIYNKYFLLGNIGGSFSFTRPRPETFNGLFDSLKEVLNDSYKEDYIKRNTPPPPLIVELVQPSAEATVFTTSLLPPSSPSNPIQPRPEPRADTIPFVPPVIEEPPFRERFGDASKDVKTIDYDKYLNEAAECLENQRKIYNNTNERLSLADTVSKQKNNINLKNIFGLLQKFFNSINKNYNDSKELNNQLKKAISNNEQDQKILQEYVNKICSFSKDANDYFADFENELNKFNVESRRIDTQFTETDVKKEEKPANTDSDTGVNRTAEAVKEELQGKPKSSEETNKQTSVDATNNKEKVTVFYNTSKKYKDEIETKESNVKTLYNEKIKETSGIKNATITKIMNNIRTEYINIGKLNADTKKLFVSLEKLIKDQNYDVITAQDLANKILNNYNNVTSSVDKIDQEIDDLNKAISKAKK